MKTYRHLILLPALALLALDLHAAKPHHPPHPNGDFPFPPPPPELPVLKALDANGDEVIDAAEIANAAAALKTLDANNDGKLEINEVLPPPPEGCEPPPPPEAP